MGALYDRIAYLCAQKGIKPGRLCSDLGISRGSMGDLKKGRRAGISTKTATKIADYFGVSVDYLLNGSPNEKAPAPEGERPISDEEIKLALFGGGGEITDAMYDEVKKFAAYVRQRETQKQQD